MAILDYMATWIWVKIGSSNGLLPGGGTKALPEQIWLLICDVLLPLDGTNFTATATATTLCNEFEKCTLKIMPHLPGANELKSVVAFSKSAALSTPQHTVTHSHVFYGRTLEPPDNRHDSFVMRATDLCFKYILNGIHITMLCIHKPIHVLLTVIVIWYNQGW